MTNCFRSVIPLCLSHSRLIFSQYTRRHQQNKILSTHTAFERPHTAMGSVFSSTSSYDGTQNTTKSLKQSSSVSANTVHKVKLMTNATGKLSDDIELVIHLDKNVYEKWKDQHIIEDSQWYIEVEVDIASLQERHQLSNQAVKLKNNEDDNNEILQSIQISSKMIKDVINNKSANQLCNISVIRLWLQSEIDGRRLTNEIVLVLDVSHGKGHGRSFEPVHDVADLSRVIYGIESDSATSRHK